MIIQINGPHCHHTRGILLFILNARHQSTMYYNDIAHSFDLSDIKDDRTSFQPPRLLIAQLSS